MQMLQHVDSGTWEHLCDLELTYNEELQYLRRYGGLELREIITAIAVEKLRRKIGSILQQQNKLTGKNNFSTIAYEDYCWEMSGSIKLLGILMRRRIVLMQGFVRSAEEKRNIIIIDENWRDWFGE